MVWVSVRVRVTVRVGGMIMLARVKVQGILC